MKNLPFLDEGALNGIDHSVLDAMAAIEAGLAALGRRDASQPHPPALTPGPGAFFQPLLASLPSENTACVNWLTYHPGNAAEGLPHSGGTLLLNDFRRGLPLCAMDGIWISHRRAGYVAGLGVKYLAGEFNDVALIGAGAIAHFAIDAIVALGLMKGTLRVNSRRLEGAEKFCHEVSARHAIKAVTVASPELAVRGARLILTSTTHTGAPFLERDWVARGCLVVMIDRLRVVTRELLDAADLVVSNSAQSLAQWGYDGDCKPVALMPEIAAAGRRRPTGPDIVLYDAGGMAVADLAYATLLWKRREQGSGGGPPRAS